MNSKPFSAPSTRRSTAVKRGELSPDELVTKLLSVTKGGGQNGENAGGLRVAANELGINRETLRLAVHVASIPQEIRDEARAAGVTTQSALLEVAAAAPEKQIEVLAGIAKKKAEKKTKAKVPKDIVLEASEYTVEPVEVEEACSARLTRIRNTITVPEEDSTVRHRSKRQSAYFFTSPAMTLRYATRSFGNSDCRVSSCGRALIECSTPLKT